MIKYIVDTTSSHTDLNGNRYHFSVITNCRTHNVISVKTYSHSNATHLLRKNGVDWSEIHSTESQLPIREFNRLEKFHHCIYENAFDTSMFKSLNRKRRTSA